jgi:hypothetical protein
VSNVFSDFDRAMQFSAKDSLSIPISFFKNVQDTGDGGFYSGINHPVRWRELSETLEALAGQPFKRKDGAPLFSPTVYQTVERSKANGEPYKGYRNEPNATTSALVVIDADKGFEFGAAARFLTEHKIEAVLYTTASNTDGSRFRIVIPLLEPIDPETHKAVVNAVCGYLKPGWKPDTSKNNCYSLFYVPGQYANASNEFQRISGSIFPAKAWLQLGGQAVSNGSDTASSKIETAKANTTWNSCFDCPYVDQEWVREYLALTDDFYNGLYQFICRVALSALRQGIELSSGQLADLARDVEGMSGRKHKSWNVETRDLEGEADNALGFARDEVAQTPITAEAPLRKPSSGAVSSKWLDWMMSDDTGRIAGGSSREKRAPNNDNSRSSEAPHNDHQGTETGPIEWDAGLDEGFIEPRQWLLGNTFARRYVSTIVADGGTGKTALRMAQAIALATGRPITGEHVFRRCRVLYVSLEDDADEMRRRIKACCLHHKIASDELRDYLFVAAVANGPKLATMTKGGVIARGDLAKMLIEIIERRNIDLVVLDPFIKSHGCDENDNNAIDLVTGLLAELAIRFNLAIDAPHHVSKGMIDPGNANRGRGASAFKDAARLVYTLSRMSQEEARQLGIDEGDRWRYVRVDSGKVNIAPAAATARWFRLVGVPLCNANIVYPSGDEVQTVEPWTPVDPMTLVGDEDLRNAILTEIENAPSHALYTAHANSGQRHVVQMFQRHLAEITKKQAEQIIEAWINDDLLRYVEFKDNRSRDRQGLAVCE